MQMVEKFGVWPLLQLGGLFGSRGIKECLRMQPKRLTKFSKGPKVCVFSRLEGVKIGIMTKGIA